MNLKSKGSAGDFDRIGNKMTSDETHEDLVEFNRTKETVNALLDYKRTLIALGSDDTEQINDIRARAIEAINHLFQDIVDTPKQKTS